jgi:hypothetical protein
MTTPGGYFMSVAMTNCGGAGWITDRIGYRYDRIDPESGQPWPPMPDCFLKKSIDRDKIEICLAEISTAVAPGSHAVVLLDQAGWHLSAKLLVPLNITLVPLPAKCPELNAIENVWQFVRDNWLSNRVFHSGENAVDPCCNAWNKLIYRSWCIMSIGLRDWAHGF